MDRAEYCTRVLSGLRGLSRREREAIRVELEDHMEDHTAALLELGYDEDLAEERTLAAMGDPAEVAREMARQYPRGWKVVTGVSLALCVLMIFSALSNRKMIGYAWDSIVYRVFPPGPETVISQFIAPRGIEPISGVTGAVDIRRTIGDDVLRVYQVTVGTQDGQLTAEAGICVYDRMPGGLVSLPSFNNLTVESQRGEQQVPFRRGAIGNPMIWQVFLRSPVQPGDDHITLRYAWQGESAAIDVPLPEEDVP